MERLINFRGWDNNNKKMIDSSLIGKKNVFIEETGCLGVGYQDYDNWHELELMQFTGETDYNNKPIYEKDILKLEILYYGERLIHYGVVKFECGSFIVGSKTLTDNYITFIELRDEWKITIINNIYEYKGDDIL